MKKILVRDGAFYVYDDDSDNGWVTLENGEHVKIENGVVTCGAGGALNGTDLIKGGRAGVVQTGANAQSSTPSEPANNTNNSDALTPKEVAVKDSHGQKVTLKRGTPMSHEQADNGRVNPNYSLGTDKYVENCQTCVFAYEMRLRGFDVEARPYGSSKYQELMGKKSVSAWETETGGKPRMKAISTADVNKAYKTLDKTIKPNERYFMSIRWKGGGAHIVTISRSSDGQLKVYDPQVNQTTVGEKAIRRQFLDRADTGVGFREKGGVNVLRVDNLKPKAVYMSNVLQSREQR